MLQGYRQYRATAGSLTAGSLTAGDSPLCAVVMTPTSYNNILSFDTLQEEHLQIQFRMYSFLQQLLFD